MPLFAAALGTRAGAEGRGGVADCCSHRMGMGYALWSGQRGRGTISPSREPDTPGWVWERHLGAGGRAQRASGCLRVVCGARQCAKARVRAPCGLGGLNCSLAAPWRDNCASNADESVPTAALPGAALPGPGSRCKTSTVSDVRQPERFAHLRTPTSKGSDTCRSNQTHTCASAFYCSVCCLLSAWRLSDNTGQLCLLVVARGRQCTLADRSPSLCTA